MHHAAAAEARVDLPGKPGLVLSTPGGWRFEVRRRQADPSPTIEFTSARKEDLLVLVMPMWSTRPGESPTRTDVRKDVQRAANDAKPRAVEAHLAIVSFDAPGKIGYYYRVTDREPEADGYRYLTQGAMAYGELFISFTILANVDPDASVKEALAMLRNVSRAR